MASSIAVLDGPLGGVASRFNALATTLGRTGIILGGLSLAVAGIGFVFRRALPVLRDYEQAMARLESVLDATGQRAVLTSDQIEQIARGVALDTLTSVNEALDAATTALTFPGVTPDNLERILRAGQDITEVFGGTLVTNVRFLGRALEDPGRAISTLERRGLNFTETQRRMIEGFIEAGDQAAALDAILTSLAQTIGGAGERAARGTLAGAADTLSQRWEEFLLQLGKTSSEADLAAFALRELAGGLNLLTSAMEGTSAVDPAQHLRDRLEVIEEMIRTRERLEEIPGLESGFEKPPAVVRLEQEAEALERVIDFMDAAERRREAVRRSEAAEHPRIAEGRARRERERLIEEFSGELRFEARLEGLDEIERRVEEFVRETGRQDFTPAEIADIRSAVEQLVEAEEAAKAAEEAIKADERALEQLNRAAERARVRGQAPPTLRGAFGDVTEAGRGFPLPSPSPEAQRVAERPDFLELQAGIDEAASRAERLAEAQAVLQRAIKLGNVDVERAQELWQQLNAQLASTDTVVGGLTRAIPSVTGALQEGARQAVVELQSLGDVLRTIETQLLNIAFRAATSPLFNLIERSATSFAGSFASGSVQETELQAGGAFQHGGQFFVGGKGGTDSTLVSFLATPGERVTVDPPGRFAGGGSFAVGGASGGPDVQIIDQRGATAPEIQTRTAQVNGRRVLRVLVRGEFDEALGESFRSHSIDGAMGSAFGVRRRGVQRG